MRTLGVDPGLAKLGWGIVEKQGNRLISVDYKCIHTSNKQSIAERLEKIYDGLITVIDKYRPDTMSIEKLFFHRNVTSALVVGQARGVAILAAQKAGLAVFEYTPLQIKQAVVGYGRAEKQQMQNMIKVLLNLEKIPRPFDAADALGAALCQLQFSKLNSLINKKGLKP